MVFLALLTTFRFCGFDYVCILGLFCCHEVTGTDIILLCLQPQLYIYRELAASRSSVKGNYE